MSFTAQDILDQLDDDARDNAAFFRDFEHGYCYHVDARLSAYGDQSRWAIIIEQLHVNPRWGSFAGTGISLCFHGNCIEFPTDLKAAKHNWLNIPDILDHGPSGPLLPNTWSDVILSPPPQTSKSAARSSPSEPTKATTGPATSTSKSSPTSKSTS